MVRCIREKGIELSVEGRAALDALADDFNAWEADPARRGTPVAAEGTNPRHPLDGWDATGFVHSDKRALLACIEAKGLKLSAAGRAALRKPQINPHSTNGILAASS